MPTLIALANYSPIWPLLVDTLPNLETKPTLKMPKFISNERLAYFTSLETAAQNIVGADSNLEDCADASELEALLTTEQPNLQAIGDAACDTLFADAGIERGEDESHESALAHHLAEFALAKSSLEELTASINAAGLTLPVASADTDITSEFITSCISEQLETMISNKSIATVAAAGATTDETPETSETDNTPQTSSEIVAHYGTLTGSARTSYFAANKAAIMAELTS